MNNKGNLQDYVSCDAPPLDFSFKNIKHLECIASNNPEIKFTQPRKGERLNPVDEDGKPLNPKVEEKEEEQEEIH